jgi:hypothetical protein
MSWWAYIARKTSIRGLFKSAPHMCAMYTIISSAHACDEAEPKAQNHSISLVAVEDVERRVRTITTLKRWHRNYYKQKDDGLELSVARVQILWTANSCQCLFSRPRLSLDPAIR